MSWLHHFFSYNIARFNRLRRKPFQEIFTFVIKRSKTFLVHFRDRLYIMTNKIELTDNNFFQKIALKDSESSRVKEALMEGNMTKAKKELLSHMRIRVTPKFFFNSKERVKITETLEKNFKHSKKQAIRSAEEICSHKFHILGKNIQYSDKIDWHSALNGDKQWPTSFSPTIDYFSAQRIGDIKLAWELNRTQHFVTLGKTFWLTNDEKYFKEWKNQLLDWIDKNPYKLGINWMEGIECAIRIISWIWTYFYFLEHQSFNEEIHFKFLKSIYLQTKFIEEHLSDKWQLNNNHIIAEAVGLIYTGIIFPEFVESKRWRKTGYRILEKELSKQILPDGVSWEQSTGYHRFVTDLCLHALILAAKNQIKISEKIRLKIEQMIEFLNQITKTDGRIPLVGDSDEARVITIDNTAYNDARSTITLGSIIFNKKQWLRIKSEEVFWLSGESILQKEQKPIYENFNTFKESGFYVMRNKDKYLLFLTGPKNKKYLHSGHKHIDMLSFILDCYGTSFIVDPGTYTYFGDFEWRKYFKSIKSHNTVTINYEDPVELNEIFEINLTQTVINIDHSENKQFDYIISKSTEYNSATHTRAIIFVNYEYWIILDFLNSVSLNENLYDLNYHINHKLNLSYDELNNNYIIKGKNGNVIINQILRDDFNTNILADFVSDQYGIKKKSNTIVYRKKGKNIKFITLIYPTQANCNIFSDVYYKNNKYIKIKIKSQNFSDYITLHNISQNDKNITLKINYKRMNEV